MLNGARFALVSVFGLITLIILINNYYPRYASWRSLSPAHISAASQWYLDNRVRDVDDVTAICFYAVNCSDNGARLALVPNPDQYDFDALRQRIWARRFKGVCQGRTSNLGLHLLRTSDSDQYEYSDSAIWSFYNNRFIPKWGHWSGGAFSEEPWERCSIDEAAYFWEGGQLVRVAR